MKIEFLIFELDNQKYGIEVKYVQQILRHSVKEDESNLIDLRKIFGLDSSSAGQSVRLTYKGRIFKHALIRGVFFYTIEEVYKNVLAM